MKRRIVTILMWVGGVLVVIAIFGIAAHFAGEAINQSISQSISHMIFGQ